MSGLVPVGVSAVHSDGERVLSDVGCGLEDRDCPRGCFPASDVSVPY